MIGVDNKVNIVDMVDMHIMDHLKLISFKVKENIDQDNQHMFIMDNGSKEDQYYIQMSLDYISVQILKMENKSYKIKKHY